MKKREGEITSLRDLLKPQYKGKIILNDPTTTGSGNALISHLAYNLWGEEKAIEFLRLLIKEQATDIQRDFRIMMESVARGKHAIAIAPNRELVEQFQEAGAPIKVAIFLEMNRISSGADSLAVPSKFAHPSASIIFINWLLSRQGQTVFVKAFGSPSRRVDVSTERMNPIFIPKPGIRYFTDNEEELKYRSRVMELAKKVIETTR